MKKLFISISILALLILFRFKPVVLAGPQCDALGGACKLTCISGAEDDSGPQDCPRGAGAFGLQQVCCVPKPIPTLIPPATLDFESQVPGLGCGVPNDPDRNKCCVITNVTTCSNSPVIDFLDYGVVKATLGNFPILGPIIYGFKNKCLETEQRINDFQSRFNSKCLYGEPNMVSGVCQCQSSEIATGSATIAKMCYQYLDNPHSSSALKDELKDCLTCSSKGKMWTGFGCIPLDIKGFIAQTLFTFGIGLGGLIALLCIIYSAFMMQTSAGNPERIKRAQENLTSCIMGLMLIIFSVFILRLIGIDILRIPFITFN